MVGNRYWMPPPRQFQPMFQVSISNPTAMLVLKTGGGSKSPHDVQFLSSPHPPLGRMLPWCAVGRAFYSVLPHA